MRLSVVERALAVVGPDALAALRPALSETKLDLRFVQEEEGDPSAPGSLASFGRRASRCRSCFEGSTMSRLVSLAGEASSRAQRPWSSPSSSTESSSTFKRCGRVPSKRGECKSNAPDSASLEIVRDPAAASATGLFSRGDASTLA